MNGVRKVETLEQDKKLLIEKCIRNNRKFQNNEDLYEQIYEETCKNSVALLAAVSSESTAELYLKRIVNNAVSSILKNSAKTEVNTIDKSAISATADQASVPVINAPEDEFNPEYSGHRVIFRNVDIEENEEDLFVKREVLKNITKILNKIETESPKEEYIKIFKMRYEDGMTQSEIAENLGISQTEVAKRMFELMQRVKEDMN